jgi:uncharacterized protein YndB with AHSA1/START domain
MNTLKITTPSDRELVMMRTFDAPRPLVWDAFTRPELLKRWFFGPDDWELAVCEIDLRVGGKYRYVWRRRTSGVEMGMGGEYREVAAPQRLVATERFDDSWYPGEAVGTFELSEAGGKTTLKQTMLYESKDARDAVVRSPMESGVRAGYDRLEQMLLSMKS